MPLQASPSSQTSGSATQPVTISQDSVPLQASPSSQISGVPATQPYDIASFNTSAGISIITDKRSSCNAARYNIASFNTVAGISIITNKRSSGIQPKCITSFYAIQTSPSSQISGVPATHRHNITSFNAGACIIIIAYYRSIFT